MKYGVLENRTYLRFNMKLKLIVILIGLTFIIQPLFAQKDPIKIGVIGLTHGHVHWIFGSEKQGNIKIVGIVETNKDLVTQFAKSYNLSKDIFYDTMEAMIEERQPEAVSAFGSVYEHLDVVKKAAPKGIHVMVEKPMAVSFDHAKQMEALAKKHKIHLLTNFETTWSPSNHEAYRLLHKDTVGALRKVVIRDGHKGPKKIGVNKEFLEWLIDPIQNGGGAITDFGCYGVNLMTWLMKGEKPISVTAVTQQQQPENNPKVDDDATIILNYLKANATIQASWNWPIGRKDMEIYGLNGVIYADNSKDVRVRIAKGYDGYDEKSYTLDPLKAPHNDPFALFAAVIRGEVTLTPFDPSSLENNMLGMEILDAAIQSAQSKKTIELKQ